ncbi:hypothetical protein EOD39_9093 [Acipenser ruthenus]|uniref:Uncharacterized protein n=1 Tax=Acipenser ruthenus TaxID=7906 RepID=A0A444U1X7_ACIRT|nr:hypothetical protein EOD39_9093 [Acipenser ruthenus]
MRPASKSTDTAGHYDGTPPWEAYLARFCLVALANSWNPGVLQVLLDLDPEEPCDFHTISTALQHPFEKVEPTVGLRHRLATRKRTSGKKLGLLPADARTFSSCVKFAKYLFKANKILKLHISKPVGHKYIDE